MLPGGVKTMGLLYFSFFPLDCISILAVKYAESQARDIHKYASHYQRALYSNAYTITLMCFASSSCKSSLWISLF